jgi:hypothetical protein
MAIRNTLRTLGMFFDRLVHFVFIWYLFPVWVLRAMKNLATLVLSKVADKRSRAAASQFMGLICQVADSNLECK